MPSVYDVRANVLFDPETNPSSFPGDFIPAVANAGGVKRALSQRGGHAFGARARAILCLRSLVKIVCLAAMLASSTLSSGGTAHAEFDVTSSETGDDTRDRSLCRVHRRSVAPLRCADLMDTRGDAC